MASGCDQHVWPVDVVSGWWIDLIISSLLFFAYILQPLYYFLYIQYWCIFYSCYLAFNKKMISCKKLKSHYHSFSNCLSYEMCIAPSPVTGFQAFYPVIVWEPPADSGVITNYEVTFSRGGQSNTYTSVLPHYVIQSSDVPGISGSFTVQVSMDVIMSISKTLNSLCNT